MKRLFAALFLTLIVPALGFGQDSAAEILESRESFQMKDVSSGTYNVYCKVRINKESAVSAGNITIFTDSDRSLSSFSATVTNTSGKVIKKIRRQDLDSRALAQELADDSFVYFCHPLAPVPYIVEYEYTLTYKRGVPAFPSYFPVTEENERLVKGEYSVVVPSGTKVQYSATTEPEVVKEDFNDRYVWRFQDYPGFEIEDMMPALRQVVPHVYASPVSFMFSKVEGQQGSWKDIGLWLYNLQKDTWDLTDEDKAKVKEMTSGCSTTYDKVKVLYDYLRDRTRYVSIQLGIGGYKPFPASTVSRTGFGDCKALSNYLKALLEVAGVGSEYYIVNTNVADLEKDYSSVGQMNHAMLAVPVTDEGTMNGDTLWVECTNPRIPLGYRHDDIAGHQVVLIKENGGELVRCGRYPDSLSRLENKVRVLLSSTGDAFVDVQERAFLGFTESRISFPTLSTKDQTDRMASKVSSASNNLKIKGIWNNFNDYPKYGRSYVPQTRIDYSFDSRSYAENNGGRLLIPLTPLHSGVDWQRGERKNDIYMETGATYLDSIEIVVPASYELESLPKPVNVECSWATLSSEFKVDGNKVTVVFKEVFKAGRYPKEDYAGFRTAARKYNNLSSARIVFRKKQD